MCTDGGSARNDNGIFIVIDKRAPSNFIAVVDRSKNRQPKEMGAKRSKAHL